MKYMVSIDVPELEDGIRFYCSAFGFTESSRPVPGYAILDGEGSKIGLLEKAAGTKPAENAKEVRHYERHWTPVHIDFHVDDFEGALARALGAGAVCEQRFEAGDHPPAAFCSDPFGNGFCLIGHESAKV